MHTLLLNQQYHFCLGHLKHRKSKMGLVLVLGRSYRLVIGPHQSWSLGLLCKYRLLYLCYFIVSISPTKKVLSFLKYLKMFNGLKHSFDYYPFLFLLHNHLNLTPLPMVWYTCTCTFSFSSFHLFSFFQYKKRLNILKKFVIMNILQPP